MSLVEFSGLPSVSSPSGYGLGKEGREFGILFRQHTLAKVN
jgi:hypothetical protein